MFRGGPGGSSLVFKEYQLAIVVQLNVGVMVVTGCLLFLEHNFGHSFCSFYSHEQLQLALNGQLQHVLFVGTHHQVAPVLSEGGWYFSRQELFGGELRVVSCARGELRLHVTVVDHQVAIILHD